MHLENIPKTDYERVVGGSDKIIWITRFDDKKEPLTTVTMWADAAIVPFPENKHVSYEYYSGMLKYSYVFKGKPYVDRVIQETLDQGILVVKIECEEKFSFNGFNNQACTIWKPEIGKLRINGWKYGSYLILYDLPEYNEVLSHDEIDETIISYLAKKIQKSKHKNGELCKFPVWDQSKKYLPEQPHHFEYTGTLTDGKEHKGRVWLADIDGKITYLPYNLISQFEILRIVVDDKSIFKRGDVVANKIGDMAEVTVVESKDRIHSVSLKGEHYITPESMLYKPSLEQLVCYDDELWTKNLSGGTRARAYYVGEFKYKYVQFCYLFSNNINYLGQWYPKDLGESIAASLGIKIKTLAEGEKPQYPMRNKK